MVMPQQEHLRLWPHPLNRDQACVWLLFPLLSSRCDYYSRAATIWGAASIWINTVLFRKMRLWSQCWDAAASKSTSLCSTCTGTCTCILYSWRFHKFCHLLSLKIYLQILPCVNDYTEDMATFTTLVKFCYTEYLCNAVKSWASKSFQLWCNTDWIGRLMVAINFSLHLM